MKQIAVSGQANREELALYRRAPRVCPGGPKHPDDRRRLAGERLPDPAADRRAVPELPAQTGILLCLHPGIRRCTPAGFGHKAPAAAGAPAVPGDWLLRFYHFRAEELLDPEHPNFDPYLDPKCSWAVQHYELFPIDINRAPFEMLLRVPGIGPKSAQRIRAAVGRRRWACPS